MKMKISNQTNSNKVFLPRWAVPLIWAVIVLVIQVLLPWAASKLGPRLGWDELTAGSWNFTGLLLVAIGLMSYAWCLVFHFRTYASSVRISFSPPHLVKSGPYRFSRNPMYVSGLFTWLGWTIFYGSPAVLIVLMLLWFVFSFRVIPHEEQMLEELFGEEFLEYKHSVRKWIGRF
jgi:protein-S-isoprenylcysteine O-methyltransferase Ste14